MKKTRKNKRTQKTGDTSRLLPYCLTNDYLFRAVFQTREKAREGLCRSILHLPMEADVKTEVRNPIELGKKIERKEFVLDLSVIVNSYIYLNLEMQMYRDPNWTERSISYTCRSFDSLNHGDSYGEVLPVIHTGFIDYDLFPEHPQFVSDYLLTDTKCGQVYSDKFRISVVNLNHIELATEEDKTYGLDLWAEVFNAKTWEEVSMLAKKNEYLQDAVSGIAVLTEDEMIREQCQAREDYEYWERIKENRHKRELMEQKNHYQEEIAERDHKIKERDDKIKEKDQKIEEQNQAISQLNQIVTELGARLAKLESNEK